ncbi:hypothetical protein PR002_g29597 [Phytophthora rubi]|uniref:Uncharacterized protein n=1 Tax=Phytophthora rubi TaxID=129364 RepID=A0A6A3H003_9STRA|nr:hypothetical protein PR002_g29597 [Phytophthora rubi]
MVTPEIKEALEGYLNECWSFTPKTMQYLVAYDFNVSISTSTISHHINDMMPSKGANLQIQCVVSSAFGVVTYRTHRGSIKMETNADFIEHQ